MKLRLLHLLPLSILTLTLFTQCQTDDNVAIIETNPNQEECDSISDLGVLKALTSSKNFIPYYSSVVNIIFSNADGEEFTGKVDFFLTNQITNNVVNNGMSYCPVDSSILMTFDWRTEITTFQLTIEDLNISLRATLIPLMDPTDYSQKLFADFLYIGLFKIVNNVVLASQQMDIILDERTHPMPVSNYTDLIDTLDIHGETFTNVYVKESDENEIFEFYFNSEVGFVGFKSMDDPALDLKFVRVE